MPASFRLPTLDPRNYMALHSLDFGSVQSPDGRDHYLDANTPVSVVSAPIPEVVSSANVVPGGSVVPVSNPITSMISGSWIPAHFGARLAVGVLAIGLLLVVAFRLSK